LPWDRYRSCACPVRWHPCCRRGGPACALSPRMSRMSRLLFGGPVEWRGLPPDGPLPGPAAFPADPRVPTPNGAGVAWPPIVRHRRAGYAKLTGICHIHLQQPHPRAFTPPEYLLQFGDLVRISP
jgi:hypothetical protein